MKRSLNYIINSLAVLLFAAGLGLLYTQMPGSTGTGISWISTETYQESPQFAYQFNSDIGRVKRLAVLKGAFEEGEAVDPSKEVIIAETDNGIKNYTLSEMMNISQKFGCRLDQNTHRITIDPSSASSDMQNYKLRIRHKMYDPDYFINQPIGPSVGVTTISELSYEVMRALSEYYELREQYQDTRSNFNYTMRYMDQSGEYVDLMNTEKSDEEIKNLGKYVIVDSENARIESNVSPIPENAFESELERSTVPHEDEYLLIAGVDTFYPYNDSYRTAADGFNDTRRAGMLGLIMMLAGAVAAVISLIPLIRYTGPECEALLRRTRIGDGLPIELYALICAAGVFISYKLLKVSLFSVIELLVPSGQMRFWRGLLKGILIYIGVLMIAQQARREEIRGILYKGSIFGRVMNGLKQYVEGNADAREVCISFIMYTLLNLAAAAAAVLLLVLGKNIYSKWTALAMFAVLATADAMLMIRTLQRRKQRETLDTAIERIAQGEIGMEIDSAGFGGAELETARNINNISAGLRTALNEQVKAERLKADLITNVSHDIRTPLTSIINYVDLLKRTSIEDPTALEYIEILNRKSERLKNLTEDLLEASKASSGNVRLDMQKIDFVALAKQAAGEFTEKLQARRLELCLSTPDIPVFICADGRHLWRVLENLYNNAVKYTLEGTRIYADVIEGDGCARFILKNISQNKLNISPDELTERFVRGDVSRSTEGSGLGLSIAKSLTSLMGGELIIEIDGDLYKATVKFDLYTEPERTEETEVKR